MKTLIGVVSGTKLDKNEERIAWIWPLVEVKGTAWEEVCGHEQEFPARGYIFWPKAPSVEKGNLFYFRAKDQGSRKDGGDDFMVVEPRSVFEVVDLRSIGDREAARKALTEGVPALGLPLSRVLVWCKGGFVVGPVQLSVGNNGLATLQATNRARIPCFQFPEGEVRQLEYEGITRWIIAKPNLGSPDSYVDWDDDKAVLKRALDYAVTQSTTGAVERPKQMIEAAVDVLTKNGSSADNRLELYRLQRGRSLAAYGTQLGADASELIVALRKHPRMIAEIEQLKAAERAEAKKDVEDALKKEREQLAKLQTERSTVEDELQHAKKSLDEIEALVRDRTREIEGKIQDRILEVLSNAPALLADVALLKPFLGGAKDPEVFSDTSIASWKRVPIRISSAKELRTRMIPIFKAMGVPTTAYQSIHAAFAGGLIPVVAGNRAVESLDAYAHVATGGRSLVIQATSAFGDVQDLFGRVVERHFVPQAAGLIDIVRAARKSEGLYLVILEGINRGATESYLLPLVRAALKHTVAVSLFHPSAVASNDPYWTESRVEWPKNLLLAATVMEGPTTLPVAPDLWNDAVLIQTDLEGSNGIPTELSTDPSEMEWPTTLLGAPSSSAASEWVEEVAACTFATATRFEGGMRTLGLDGAVLHEAIAKCVLVPFLASINDEDERKTQTKAVKKTSQDFIEGWIRAARRRIS